MGLVIVKALVFSPYCLVPRHIYRFSPWLYLAISIRARAGSRFLWISAPYAPPVDYFCAISPPVPHAP